MMLLELINYHFHISFSVILQEAIFIINSALLQQEGLHYLVCKEIHFFEISSKLCGGNYLIHVMIRSGKYANLMLKFFLSKLCVNHS